MEANAPLAHSSKIINSLNSVEVLLHCRSYPYILSKWVFFIRGLLTLFGC